MKWLTLLFALYLLTLSCMPCLCADTCEEAATAAGHQPKKEKEDNCTPFCTFSCCPVCAVNNKGSIAVNKPCQPRIRKAFPLFNNHFTSYNSHNIWQPPKILC